LELDMDSIGGICCFETGEFNWNGSSEA
jgi:hypothetical protein